MPQDDAPQETEDDSFTYGGGGFSDGDSTLDIDIPVHNDSDFM